MLKFVICIYPRHAEPTAKLLFKKSTKIVHIFNFFKKNLKFCLKNLRDCAQISFGCTYSHISSVRSSVRMVPMRLCFFLNITKHSHAFLAL